MTITSHSGTTALPATAAPPAGELWRAVFPAAVSLGKEASLERVVAWVRVLKPRTPAFDALEPNDLAILPAAALSSLTGLGVDPASVAIALADAGASGLLLVGQTSAAAPLIDAARARELAVFALDDADVAALERSAIGFVINARAELEARAGELELQLEQQVLAGAGSDGLAGTIARFLARPVAIEAADGSLLALHAPADAAATAPWLA
ncbi:MAG: PucR family transcriptional regulator ligand-binding domain-containing protein, partial [Chloroflexota bacterium]|nr:PucR family transcriptional regulator ligand-binding domain-containing protein [Chloroflexota bacterium]